MNKYKVVITCKDGQKITIANLPFSTALTISQGMGAIMLNDKN